MKEDLIRIFDRQALRYGRRQGKKDFAYKWRARLLKEARGKILEVAAGAGANFEFYPKGAEAVIVDASRKMIEEAKKSALKHNVRAEFLVADVEETQFQSRSFDTIISTFSICSYTNPLRVLKSFNLWCKKGGRILLLEHGASRHTALKWLQNILDPLQVRILGCHLNRDIYALLAESGLAEIKHEYKFFGIIHLVSATPKN